MLLLITLVGVVSNHGQERISLHFTGGGLLTAPVNGITSLGGVPSPQGLLFSGGSASWQPWFMVGADAELVPGNPNLRLGGRVGVSWNRFYYGAQEPVPLATEDGTVYNATIQHDLEVRFATVFAEPFLRYQLEPWLAVEGGIPLYLSSASYYDQRMRFSDPEGQEFVDGSTEVFLGSGPIPRLSTIVPAVHIAAEGLIPLRRGRSLFLTPRVAAVIPLLPWESASGMRTFTALVGLGVRYHFTDGVMFEDGIRRDTIALRDTILLLSERVTSDTVIYVGELVEEYPSDDVVNVLVRYRYQKLIPKPPSVLKAGMRAAFEEGDGAIIGGASMRVHTVQRTRRLPLIPLVVFQPVEHAVPDRYVRLEHAKALTWTEKHLFDSTGVHWQYHVLNVVGSRMRDQPGSVIDIVSYDDGTADGAILNAQRTTSVREYLSTSFGIDPSRITLTTMRGKSTEKPWVVLSDPTRRLLQPISITDTLMEVQVPKLRLTPDVVSEAGLRSWKVVATAEGDTLYKQEGSGPVPKHMFWDMSADVDASVVSSGSAISVVLCVVDRDGQQKESEPTRIVLAGDQVPVRSDQITLNRTVALRWLGPDDVRTSDRELLGNPRDYDIVPVIRGKHRRWIRAGLTEPEQQIIDKIELYEKNERRP